MSEEWGPWQEHDGKGCPVALGQHYQAEYDDGDMEEGVHGFYGTLLSGAGWRPENGSWLWHEDYQPIIRLRIRKPRGLTILENLIADLPAPVAPKVDA